MHFEVFVITLKWCCKVHNGICMHKHAPKETARMPRNRYCREKRWSSMSFSCSSVKSSFILYNTTCSTTFLHCPPFWPTTQTASTSHTSTGLQNQQSEACLCFLQNHMTWNYNCSYHSSTSLLVTLPTTEPYDTRMSWINGLFSTNLILKIEQLFIFSQNSSSYVTATRACSNLQYAASASGT